MFLVFRGLSKYSVYLALSLSLLLVTKFLKEKEIIMSHDCIIREGFSMLKSPVRMMGEEASRSELSARHCPEHQTDLISTHRAAHCTSLMTDPQDTQRKQGMAAPVIQHWEV